MSKITICEGEILYTSKGNTIIHAFDGNITTHAQEKNIWKDENGTLVGEYKKMDLPIYDDFFPPLLTNIIINFIRSDKNGIGNFINKEFEENGWYIIDASSLKEALTKLKLYLGTTRADNIFINAHGFESQRYILDGNGEASRDPVTNKYIMAGDTGFCAKIEIEGILGSQIQQYISDKSKLSPDMVNSIECFIEIVKYVKEGKNLVMGSCNSARYDDLFGSGISSIVKSIDIFINRDYSSLFVTPDKKNIPFQNFTNYNQTSKHNYIKGWVWYKNGAVIQQNFNIKMTKYGVKTIK